jgi:isopentenyl-diphosphate delta-isomerase
LKLILGELDVPVYVKEVGSGIDPSTARKLHELGVKTLDVGGAGGTSWTKIEGMRASDRLSKRLAESLSNFGKSTASSIKDIKDADLALELIATGGIRDGHDIAKSIAIGADFCGIGLPFFRAALESQAAVEDEFNFFAESLKIVMLATGSKTLESLSSALRYRGASQ